MAESVAYGFPRKARLLSSIRSNLSEWSSLSEQKKALAERVQLRISCYYQSVKDIPDDPHFGALENAADVQNKVVVFRQASFEASDFQKVIEIELKKEEERRQKNQAQTQQPKELRSILKKRPSADGRAPAALDPTKKTFQDEKDTRIIQELSKLLSQNENILSKSVESKIQVLLISIGDVKKIELFAKKIALIKILQKTQQQQQPQQQTPQSEFAAQQALAKHKPLTQSQAQFDRQHMTQISKIQGPYINQFKKDIGLVTDQNKKPVDVSSPLNRARTS